MLKKIGEAVTLRGQNQDVNMRLNAVKLDIFMLGVCGEPASRGRLALPFFSTLGIGHTSAGTSLSPKGIPAVIQNCTRKEKLSRGQKPVYAFFFYIHLAL